MFSFLAHIHQAIAILLKQRLFLARLQRTEQLCEGRGIKQSVGEGHASTARGRCGGDRSMGFLSVFSVYKKPEKKNATKGMHTLNGGMN
jgi:hypothetical protein